MKPPMPTESSQKFVKILKKTVKRAIAEQGINTATRKGSKELELLIRKIVKEPFKNQEQAQKVGEKIAQTIVEISQKRGKTDLDRGVIRQIVIEGKIPPIAEINSQIAATTSKSSVSTPAKSQETIKEPEITSIKPTTEEKSQNLEAPQSPVTTQEIPIPKNTEPLEETPKSEPFQPKTEISSPKAQLTAPETDNSMMSLKERIGEDIKAAMKAQDKIRLETVRSIKKALIEKEVALRPSGQDNLTPEQEIELLAQQAKQRRESIEQFQNAQRDDLAQKEAQELAIIETYLPQQLSEEEINTILDEIIAKVGATSPKDIGKVMGVAVPQLKGKADGKKIQALVKSKLEQD